MQPHSLYIHIPFCSQRCAYCDFNTYAGLNDLIPDYVSALCREVEFLAEAAGTRVPIHTLYFGGGTPSLLPLVGLEKILSSLRASFDLQPGLEITLEANPGTLSLPYLRGLRSLGVNRLSLGMQSARSEELRLLERRQEHADVILAVGWARRAGFANLNLDLLFSLPDQSLEAWQHNLTQALNLHSDHFSLYALTLEQGTPLHRWVARGLLSEPDPDLGAEMYEWAGEQLDKGGYVQYEISNWAKANSQPMHFACLHNLQYWRNQPYLGLGAGAHGYANGVRTANVLRPAAYIQRLLNEAHSAHSDQQLRFPRTPATVTAQPVELAAEIAETMMMGLRLTQEGISRAAFYNRFGQSLEERFEKEINELLRIGLLEWVGPEREALRLTPKGRLLGNQVFMEFV